MTSDNVFSIIMIAIGITATLVPLYFASKFWKDFHGFGLVLAVMLIGESIAMGVTTEFAISGLADYQKNFTLLDYHIRRMFVFLPCLLSTVVLGTFYLRKITEAKQKTHTHKREDDIPKDY